MPDVYRTQNILEATRLDGVSVIIQENPPNVVSAGFNTLIFLGRFYKGEENRAYRISSLDELETLLGGGDYEGFKALSLKNWSNLNVVRVVASNAVASSVDLQHSGTGTVLSITARSKGDYGNTLKVTLSDGSGAGLKNLVITDGTITERFDDVALAGKSDAQLLSEVPSRLVVLSNAHASEVPDNVVDQALAGGHDGQVQGSDYESALENVNVRGTGKIYFADNQSPAVNSVLANKVKVDGAGLAVLGNESLSATVDEAVTDYQLNAGNAGRVLYAYNPVLFNINGELQEENPVYSFASILSLIAPNLSPASVSASRNLTAPVGVKYALGRSDLIKLREAGICAFEDDSDLGVKLVSAVTSNPQYSIIRRRMSDWITNSIGLFLKNFIGEPNNRENRDAIRVAIQDWRAIQVNNKVLPSDNEVDEGLAFSVQTEGITSDNEKAQGILKVNIRFRIFASAQFIILLASIGENVSIEEGL